MYNSMYNWNLLSRAKLLEASYLMDARNSSVTVLFSSSFQKQGK